MSLSPLAAKNVATNLVTLVSAGVTFDFCHLLHRYRVKGKVQPRVRVAFTVSPTRPRAGPRTHHGKSLIFGLLHKTVVAGAFRKKTLMYGLHQSLTHYTSILGSIAIFGSLSGTGRKAKNSLGQHRDAPFAEYDLACSVGILSTLSHFSLRVPYPLVCFHCMTASQRGP
jgi:hypothetical protein